MGTIQIDGSTPKLTIGNATAEDALILFDGNAQDFYIALDDSADDLVIGLGSTVGTTPAISINSDRDVTISDGAIDFDIASHDTSNGLKLGGTLVTATAAELNIMDGVTSTAAEINLIDGGTARGTTALADGDGILINDAGTMRMTNVTTVKTYMGGAAADDITAGDAAVSISTTSGSITIENDASDADIIFKGNDGGSDITALTLDMSADGHATFKNGITLSDGDITVASGHGIDFSAHGQGSGMETELLGDYEEGTWTAAFSNTSESGGNTTGYYTKIGRLVHIGLNMGGMTLGSSSGVAAITGIPFTTASGSNEYGHAWVGYADDSSPLSGKARTGYFGANQTTLTFWQTDADAASNWVDGSSRDMSFNGTFWVD